MTGAEVFPWIEKLGYPIVSSVIILGMFWWMVRNLIVEIRGLRKSVDGLEMSVSGLKACLGVVMISVIKGKENPEATQAVLDLLLNNGKQEEAVKLGPK